MSKYTLMTTHTTNTPTHYQLLSTPTLYLTRTKQIRIKSRERYKINHEKNQITKTNTREAKIYIVQPEPTSTGKEMKGGFY